MPQDLDKRLRLLEELAGVSAVSAAELRPQQPRVDLAKRFEIAERSVDAIISSGALSKEDAARFSKIADLAIKDTMREALRGGAGETAATINVTVAGTGTISVS